MRKQQKPPAVVAELGRPETPAETAARKAHDSRLYRQRKTVNNLVFSLLVSLGLVLVIVLVVPRGTDTFAERSVDVAGLAADASPGVGRPLLAPATPEGWKAKQAELRHSAADGITYWYVGYTTEHEAYASVVQAFTADGAPANETWTAERLERQSATGTELIGGLDWTVYDHPERSADSSNMRFGLSASTSAGTVLVTGTDSGDVIRALAARVAAELATPEEEQQ